MMLISMIVATFIIFASILCTILLRFFGLGFPVTPWVGCTAKLFCRLGREIIFIKTKTKTYFDSQFAIEGGGGRDTQERRSISPKIGPVLLQSKGIVGQITFFHSNLCSI